jgi:predicted O-methyltransferase YrrM
MSTIRDFGTIAKTALLGTPLASLPLLIRPRQFVSFAGETLFLHRARLHHRGLPERNVYRVFPGVSVCDITLGNLADPDDDTYLFDTASYATDLVNLCLLTCLTLPQIIFEIGTLSGYTALHLALNSPPGARIYTLDLPPTASPALSTTITDAATRTKALCFQGTDIEGRVTRLFGDSATFDYSPYFEKVDLFFIDGAHSYAYVKSDTEHALRCCHPGSVIAWHDFGRVGINGVTTYLTELAKTHPQLFVVPGGSLAYLIV